MLTISKTWEKWGKSIDDQINLLGINRWREFPEIIKTIEFNNKTHYYKYFDTYMPMINTESPHIIEFGAGFGGMSELFLTIAEVRLTNIDIDPMLKLQKHYLANNKYLGRVQFIPTLKADSIQWDQSYFFSTFAFTETTPETWEHYIQNFFPKVSAVYILGSKGWGEDNLPEFNWDKLSSVFKRTKVEEKILGGVPGIEFFGYNFI